MFNTTSLLSVLAGQPAPSKADDGLFQLLSGMQTRSGPAIQPRQMDEVMGIGSLKSKTFERIMNKGYLTKKELHDALHNTGGALSGEKISEVKKSLSEWHQHVEKVLASQRKKGSLRERSAQVPPSGSSVYSYLPASMTDAEIAARDLAFAANTWQFWDTLPQNMDKYAVPAAKAVSEVESVSAGAESVGTIDSIWSGGSFSSIEFGASAGSGLGGSSSLATELGIEELGGVAESLTSSSTFGTSITSAIDEVTYTALSTVARIPFASILLGLLVLAASLIPVVLGAEGKLGDEKPPGPSTVVSISIGGFGSSVPSEDGHSVAVKNDNQEGSMPHLKIWGDNGVHLGTYNGDEDGHLGSGSTTSFEIKHKEDKEAQRGHPTYLAVYMKENDAICVSHIKMQGPNGVGFNWLGDVGYDCGWNWYYNDVMANAAQFKPKCTWLDADLQKGPQGMGIHMPDFVGYTERVMQYRMKPESLCSSPPRFQMYDHFTDKDALPIFDPPLEYLDDGTDKDIKKVVEPHWKATDGKVPKFKKGEFRHPPLAEMFGMRPITNKVVDHEIEKEHGVKPKDQPKPAKPITEDPIALAILSQLLIQQAEDNAKEKRAVTTEAYPAGTEIKLVSSDHEEHDIQELCDKGGKARGPDFVSIHQGYFCDMSRKELWPLCDDERGVGYECFNYANKTLTGPASGVGKRDIHGREIPDKEYLHEYVWRAGKESKRKLITWK